MHCWASALRRSKGLQHSLRRLSSSAQKSSSQAQSSYSDTLFLPKTSFALRNDPEKDVTICSRTTEELYRWQWENAQGPLFVFHDGPPYANGDLHMGHALNKILKDIINRYHVLIGDRVHYIPGWDCHGLPIENKVLKELGRDAQDMPPGDIRREAESYARSQVRSQAGQFRQFGVMAGWNRESTYLTLDHEYEIRQLRVFQQMCRNGLIFRQYRPVHYSPSSQTALADAELEYNDKHTSHSAFVTFDIDLNRPGATIGQSLRSITSRAQTIQLLAWTTTPWTLSANMGLAVNPEMKYTALSSKDDPNTVVVVATERLTALQTEVLGELGLSETVGELTGRDLVGISYRPLFSPINPSHTPAVPPTIHAWDFVTPDTGTGIVHLAPAHGHEDYQLFKSLGLITSDSPDALVSHVDDRGCFTTKIAEVVGDAAGVLLDGKPVLDEGGREISSILAEAGILKKTMRIKHKYPYDWKTGKPIIVTATSQWFADVSNIKENAMKVLDDVEFDRPEARELLKNYVQQRSEWCISRQRVWGVPIPALYHIPSGRALLDNDSLDHIISVLDRKGTSHWWDGPVEDFLPPTVKAESKDYAQEWRKGMDTMDVWFDSGTSWSMLSHMQGDRKHLADVCLEGVDQHRGWFQSQLLTAVGSTPADAEQTTSPYGMLITHGMVLDEKGKKMSKSLGNILSPLTVINGGKGFPAYGTGVLRLWAASIAYWHDTRIGPKVLANCEETHRKIRNTLRFLLANIGDKRQPADQRVKREDISLLGRYVMHKLYTLEQGVHRSYRKSDFPAVVEDVSIFVKETMSALYMNITKDRLYADKEDSKERREILTVFEEVLDTLTSLVAPMLPHLAEEVHKTLHKPEVDGPLLSIFAKPWAPLSDEWHCPAAEQQMKLLLDIRRTILQLLEQARSDKHIGNSLEADVDIVSESSASIQHLLLPQDGSDGPSNHGSIQLDDLARLFIVSDVRQLGRSGESVDWEYTAILSQLPGVTFRVRPAAKSKCPRCWTHTREPEHALCLRCTDAIRPLD